VSNLDLVIEGNSSLNSALILHRLKTLLPLLKFERLIDNTCNLDLPGIEIVDGGGKFVGLGERTQDGDLVADYFSLVF
jgi:hypothetical protein